MHFAARKILIKQSEVIEINTNLVLTQLDFASPDEEGFGKFLKLKPDEMWSKAALCNKKWIDFARTEKRFVLIGVSESDVERLLSIQKNVQMIFYN